VNEGAMAHWGAEEEAEEEEEEEEEIYIIILHRTFLHVSIRK
jgi:hypothetical protein